MRRPFFLDRFLPRRDDDLEAALVAFLAAERAAGDDVGDDEGEDRGGAALARLFVALPLPPAPADFARRVTRAALGVPRAAIAWPWLAGGAAAGFALAAGVASLLLAAGLVDPGATFADAAGGWVALGSWLGPAADLVRLVVQVRDAVVLAVAGTAAGPAVLAALVVSSLALRRLTFPSVPPRSSAHA